MLSQAKHSSNNIPDDLRARVQRANQVFPLDGQTTLRELRALSAGVGDDNPAAHTLAQKLLDQLRHQLELVFPGAVAFAAIPANASRLAPKVANLAQQVPTVPRRDDMHRWCGHYEGRG